MKASLASAIALSFGLATQSADAQPTRPAGQSAADYQTSARNALNAFKYEEALKSLEECYPRTRDLDCVWFTARAAGQAYSATKGDEYLRTAVLAYRRYLKEGSEEELSRRTRPQGTLGPPRRDVAKTELARLEPQFEKLPAPPEPVAPETPVAPVAPAPLRTGIVVSSSTPGATITLDGKMRADGFLQVDLAPGPHHIKVEAEGYKTLERDIPVQTGALINVDAPLDPQPALLTISGPSGADVLVDSEPKGTLPLRKPLNLPAGQRLITVQKAGARPFLAWRDLERGARYDVDADLDTTGQRFAAWATFAVAGGAGVAAGVLTGLAVAKDDEAAALIAPVTETTGSMPESDLEVFKQAVNERDNLRTGAGVAWGVAGAGLTAGIFLFVFDQPAIQAPPAPPKGNGAPGAGAAPDTGVELSLAPSFGPDGASLGIRGRY